jgi:hypothetical protein
MGLGLDMIGTDETKKKCHALIVKRLKGLIGDIKELFVMNR